MSAKEKGQSLVELAISFVFIMFLLAGVVEFGLAFFQYIQLRDASQEGALYGSICDCSEEEIVERARASSDSPINLEEALVSVSVADTLGNPKSTEDACEEDAMTVTISYAHKIFMPFIPKLISRSEIVLTAYTTDTVLVPSCQ